MQKTSLFFLILFLSFFYQAKSNSVIDSLQQQLQQIDSLGNPNVWTSIAFELAEHLSDESNYNEALPLYKQILPLSQRTNNTKLWLKTHLSIGELHYYKGDNEKALQALEPVFLDQNLENTFPKTYGKAARIQGMCYVFMGNYTKAYQLQIQALNIFSRLDDSLKIAMVNYDIGNTYFYQEQYKAALGYFEKARKIYASKGNTSGLLRSNAALGSVYGYFDDFDKALEFNQLALNSAKQSGNKLNISWTSLNVGANYYSKKDYTRALVHLEEGLQISQDRGDDLLTSNIMAVMGRVYAGLNNYTVAIKYFHQALDIAKNNNDKSNIREIYKWFAEMYYEKGDLENYHSYTNQFINLKDSLYNEEVMFQMNNLKKDFEIQNTKREKEIALLKKNEEIDFWKKSGAIGMIVLALLVMSLILILMFNRNKNQKALNQLLARKNEEILLQNQRLETSNRDLEQFAHIISHDLKEPLRNISGFTALLKRRCRQYQDPEASEYMEFVFRSVRQMNYLLNDLLDYAKLNAQNKEKEKVDCNKLVVDVIDVLQHRINEENVKISVTPLPVLMANSTQLIQVFQNLISNAIKFRKTQQPLIHIQYQESENQHIFSVSDNGIGIEEQYFDKIFVPFQRLHNRAEYEGSGIGLSTCKKIIEEHGGKIWVQSSLGKGSIFYFSLPKLASNTTTNKATKVQNKELVS